jgi:hypothetical protein
MNYLPVLNSNLDHPDLYLLSSYHTGVNQQQVVHKDNVKEIKETHKKETRLVLERWLKQ